MKRIFIIFILFFAYHLNFSQTIFSLSETHQYTLKSSVQTPQMEIAHRIFSRIAEGNSTIITALKHDITYHYSALISQSDKDSYKIKVYIDSIKPLNAFYYKGINIADFILPSCFDIKLSLFTATNNLFKSWEFKKLKFRKYLSILDTTITTQTDLNQSRISISSSFLYFSKQDEQLCFAAMEYIDKYYNSISAITEMEEKLRYIRLDELDMVPINEMKLCEIETKLIEIEGYCFAEKLSLHNYDPAGYLKQMNDFKRKYIPIKSVHDSLYYNLDKVYVFKGEKLLKSGDTTQAIEYFDKAVNLNFLYYPAYLAAIRSEFGRNRIDTAIGRFISVSKYPGISKLYLNEFQSLAKKIYSILLARGAKYCQSADFNDAVAEYSRAKRLCSNVEILPCDDELEKGFQRAHQGIYNSYLNVARKAIQNNKTDLAEKYINFARSYQRDNAQYIPSSVEAEDLLEGVYHKFITLAEKQIEAGQFDEALQSYDKAKEVCAKYNAKPTEKINQGIYRAKYGKLKKLINQSYLYLKDSIIDKAESYAFEAKQFQTDNPELAGLKEVDSLIGKLKVSFYKKYIADARMLLYYENYYKAFSFLKSAREIERNYLIVKDTSLNGLIYIAAKPLLEASIKRIEFKIWANELDSAKFWLDSTLALCDYSGHKNNQTFSSKLTMMNAELRNKICNNLQLKIDNLFYQAEQAELQKKFINTQNICEEILTVKSEHYDCPLNKEMALKKVQQIADAYQYQKLLADAWEMQRKKKFLMAVEKYSFAEKLFSEKNVSRFALTHQSLTDYIGNSNDDAFIDFTLNYWLEKREPEKSFASLMLLTKRDYPISLIRKYLKKTGKQLALKDKKEGKKKDANPLIIQIDPANKKINILRKAYNRTFALGFLNIFD